MGGSVVSIQYMSCPVRIGYLQRLEKITGPDVHFSSTPRSYAIDAGSRKLVSGLTLEVMQDIRYFDICNEVAQALGYEAAVETTNEIMADINHLATNLDVLFKPSNQELIDTINKCSVTIAHTTHQLYDQILLVTDDRLCARLLNIPALSTYTIQYCPDRLSPPRIYMAAKRIDHLAGMIYAPYIPFMISDVPVINPVTYQPYYTLMTRYGKVVDEQSANFYGVITVQGID